MSYEPDLGWDGCAHSLHRCRPGPTAAAGDTDVSAEVITEFSDTLTVTLQLEWRKTICVRRQLWQGPWHVGCYAFSSIRWIDGGRGVCVSTWTGHDHMQLRVWF